MALGPMENRVSRTTILFLKTLDDNSWTFLNVFTLYYSAFISVTFIYLFFHVYAMNMKWGKFLHLYFFFEEYILSTAT